ncbi:hypothetical protein, partial [Pseudoflavonifractor sp. An184]|uniref:hypothetical protein n=1 Tax=Pseudoflavonifractor sp. An184 TaxID=1965576 RepID=UPI0019523A98
LRNASLWLARNYHFTGFSSLSHSFYLLLHLHCKSARAESNPPRRAEPCEAARRVVAPYEKEETTLAAAAAKSPCLKFPNDERKKEPPWK